MTVKSIEAAAFGSTVEKSRRLDGGKRITEDAVRVIAKAFERGGVQCSCAGSDQRYRPVTALNCRSRLPKT